MIKNKIIDFHQKTKIIKKEKEIPTSKWPKEWKEIYYKGYPRLDSISLLTPKVKNINYGDVFLKKTSASKTLTFQDISDFLYFGAGIKKTEKRFYPSAGARYPLEVYFVATGIEDLEKGVYHFYLKGNYLEYLTDYANSDFKECFPSLVKQKMKGIFIITAVFKRTTGKYADRGYRHILVEAGHLAQNIFLLAGAKGFKFNLIEEYDENQLDKILDIDGVEESVLYSFYV